MAGRRAKTGADVRPRLPEALKDAALPRDDLVDDALLHGLRFHLVDLSTRTARLVEVDACRFVGTSIAGSVLDKVQVLDCAFQHCDLANVHLGSAALTRVELSGCRATGLVASGSLLRNVSFRDCIADLSAFRFATFTKVELVDCRLHGADFVSADLTGATFRRCDLSRAELSQVQARGAVFIDCVWDGVRGVTSLAGSTVVHSSPLDAHAFMLATAGSLGITIGDSADFPEAPPAPL